MRIPSARFFLALAVAGAVAVTLFSPPGKPSIAQRVLARIGVIRPAIAVPPVVGGSLALAQPSFIPVGSEPPKPVRGRGHALLIDIFATWCPPCREELASLQLTAPALEKRGIEITGIDRAESASQVQATMQAYGLHYPVYIDTGAFASWASFPHVIPTTILLDTHGIVRYVHEGPLDPAALLRLRKLARA